MQYVRSRCFLVEICWFILWKTKLWSSDQESSISVCNNTIVVAWKCVPTAILVDVDTPDSCLLQMGFYFLLRVTELTISHSVTPLHFDFVIYVLQPNEIVHLWKLRNRDKSESHSSLILRFTNIQDLLSNFHGKEFCHEWNFPEILSLRKANFQASNAPSRIHVTICLR